MMEEAQKTHPFRSGMVSIVGRPNVGKSTLVNRIIGEKIAIVSQVPQTTRNQVRGIYHEERGQIVFIDTPGFHMTRDHLDRYMNKAASGCVEDVDCVVHLVDTKDPVGREEEEIVRRLHQAKVPVIVGLNKVDLGGKRIPEYINLWEQVMGHPVQEKDKLMLLPLSGREGTNIDQLLNILFDFLPEGPPLYPEDTVTDIPQKMAIADVVREKLFCAMRQEIPHAIAVIIEELTKKKRGVYHIRALILVEKETQKEIVIGKRGSLLKEIGILARQELEDLLEARVFLDLHVKCRKHWRDDYSLLEEMGYS